MARLDAPPPMEPHPARRLRDAILGLALLGALGACSVELDRFSAGGPCAAQSTRAQDMSANELVANPSLEEGLVGWIGWNAEIERVAVDDAPAGRHVVRVLHTDGALYSLDDQRGSVRPVPSGDPSYCAVAYVRSASPSAEGKHIELNLRERTPSGEQPNLWSSERTTLSPTFQRLTVQTTGPGPTAGNTLDFYVVQHGAEEGDAFVADLLGLARRVDDAP